MEAYSFGLDVPSRDGRGRLALVSGSIAALALAALCYGTRDEWLPFAAMRLDEPAVRLLEAGAEPRRVVRFDHRAPPRPFESIHQEGLVTFRGILQGEESYTPPLAVHWEPSGSVTRLGVSRTNWRVAAVEALADEKVPEPVRVEVLTNAQSLLGQIFVAYVGPRGQLRIEPPKSREQAAASLVERTRRLLRLQLAVSLPEEPIGKGAVWEVTFDEPVALAASVEHRVTCVLDDLYAEGIDVSIRAMLEGQPQIAKAAHALIDEIEGDYQARIVLLTNEATPVQTEFSLRSGMAAIDVAADRTTATDEERQHGAKIVLRSRALLQATAIGKLEW